MLQKIKMNNPRGGPKQCTDAAACDSLDTEKGVSGGGPNASERPNPGRHQRSTEDELLPQVSREPRNSRRRDDIIDDRGRSNLRSASL